MTDIYTNEWQKYLHGIARAVAANSKCHSRMIGAILVRDKSIIASGYNGPARGIPQCSPCSRPNKEPITLCPAAHAEANCIANAARMGVCTKGSTMFVTCEIPCKDCLSILINAGVTHIYVEDLKFYDDTAPRIAAYINLTIYTYK